MTDFQKLGTIVKKMQADGVPAPKIDAWLKQANTDLATLNASGFGPQPTSAEPASKASSFVQGAGQGMSANFGDEIGAALAATIGRPTSQGLEPIPGEDWVSRYQAARDEIRSKMEGIKQSNPGTFIAGQVTGAVVPAIVAPELYGSSYIAKAPTMLNMMGRSAAVGGAFGGINAFGAATGTPEEQAMQTAIGTGTGAAVGGAVPPLVKGGTAAVKSLYDRIKSLIKPSQVITETPSTAIATLDAFNAARPPVSATVSANERMKAISEVSKALQRDGYSVDQIKAMLGSLGPEATLADISEATQRLLRTQKSAPGAAGQIITSALENRQAGQQERLSRAAQEAFNVGGKSGETIDALMYQRSQNARPLYENFYQVDPEVLNTEYMQRLLQSPTGQQLLGRARQIYELERLQGLAPGNLFKPLLDAEGNLTTQVAPQSRVLDYIKQAIDDQVQEYINPMTGRVQGPLGNAWEGLRRTFIEDIDNALSKISGPMRDAYKNARAAYAGPTRSMQAIEAGKAFARSSDEGVAKAISSLDPDDRELFKLGALEYVKSIIKDSPPDVSVVQKLRKTGLIDKIREIIPDEATFKKYIDQLEKERLFAKTRSATLGGSQTAEKLLDAAEQARALTGTASDVMTGNKAGLLSRAAQTIGNMVGPGEGTRAAIAEALTTSDPVKLNEILKQISALARAQAAMNKSAAVGAVTGAQAAGSSVPGVFGRRP